jgi:circadian clock protein KaiC
MLIGNPGTGKTLLIQQLCFAWARRQQEIRRQAEAAGTAATPEPSALASGLSDNDKKKNTRKNSQPTRAKAIYFSTLSEPHDKLIEHISQMDFFDETFFVEDIRLLSLTSVMDEGLEKVADLIVDTVRHENAGFICIDGFRALEGLAASPDAIRRFLYRLSAQLNLLGVTAVIALERSLNDTGSEGDLTIADVIIGLYNVGKGARVYNRVEVRKVRGLRQVRGLHTYDISQKGWTIYPRFESLAPQLLSYPGAGPTDTRVGFGLPALEKMLGGGLPRGSTTLLAGSLGVGKTLLSLSYLMEGARLGEAGLYVGFYESAAQLFAKAERFGMDLRGAVENGLVRLLNFAPIQLEPDVVAALITQAVEQHRVQRFVLDGVLEIEEASRFGNRTHDFLAALVGFSKEKNITTIYTYKISKIIGAELDISNTPLSILAEDLILLRQIERQNRFVRVISILQMRDSSHDSDHKEFTIEPDTGINIREYESGESAPVSGLAGGFNPAN